MIAIDKIRSLAEARTDDHEVVAAGLTYGDCRELWRVFSEFRDENARMARSLDEALIVAEGADDLRQAAHSYEKLYVDECAKNLDARAAIRELSWALSDCVKAWKGKGLGINPAIQRAEALLAKGGE